MGKLNLPELMTITTEERLLKFHIQEYERATRVILPVCSKLCNRSIDTTFGILDVKGEGRGTGPRCSGLVCTCLALPQHLFFVSPSQPSALQIKVFPRDLSCLTAGMILIKVSI